MQNTTTISLEFVKDEQGITLVKDANDLLYFSESSGELINDYHGGPRGFKKIEIYEKVVMCTRVLDFFQIWLRDKKKWLSYPKFTDSPHQSFDFYEDKILSLTNDFIQLSTEGSPQHHYAIYLFNEDRFIMDGRKYHRGDLGYFKICEKIGTFRNESALFLSCNQGYSSPDKQVYLIKSNTFVTIPLPLGYQRDNEENTENIFSYVCGRYCLLVYGNYPEKHFVYSFDKENYLSLCGETEKLIGSECTPDHYAGLIKYQTSPDADWHVFNTATWEKLSFKFRLEVKTERFSGVVVTDGVMTILTDVKTTLSKDIK